MRIEVRPEICCDECLDVVHNHMDCPVCNKKDQETDQYCEILNGDIVTCECGARFRCISWCDREFDLIT